MPISAEQLELSGHLEGGGTGNRQLRIKSTALGNGLEGGGASSISIKLATIPGLEFSGSALRLKLDGSSLLLSASGVKFNAGESVTFTNGLKRTGVVSASDDVTDKAYVDSVIPSPLAPASSVVTELSYGQAAVVGTSLLYSRQDHTHGTPSLPTAAQVGSPPTTRSINTTAGLSGGGDLSADRTIQPTYGSGSQTVCEGNDSRLSNSRTPSGVASGDLGGSYPSPTVVQARGVRETAGPTTLTFGAIADNELLKRVGSTIVGVVVAIAIGLSPEFAYEAPGSSIQPITSDAGSVA